MSKATGPSTQSIRASTPLTPRVFVVQQWRALCRMRTAVILLVIVGELSFIAALLPQKALQPVRATGWVQNHQVLGPIFDNLGFFSVYESWWIIGAAALMYVSLTHCVWVRGRALVRRWRRGLPRNAQFIGEAGSLVFHLSFFVLLAGILYGKAFGFAAFVDVVEGQSVVEARASYDQIEEGIFFDPTQHRGFEVKVDDFKVTYFPDGRPSDFISHVEVVDGNRKVDEKRIRVNDYLNYQDVKFYQASYGWAPEVRVTTSDGRKVYDQPVVFFGDPKLSNGVLKIPSAGPPPDQLGGLMFMVPDIHDVNGASTAGSANPDNPALLLRLFKGDLQSDRAQNVYQLDTSRMTQVYKGGVGLGETVVLPNGYNLSFPRLLRYTGLQVTYDPGLPVIWASFVLMLGGLIVRLYIGSLLGAREERIRERRRAAAKSEAEAA
ncbi:MAG: cytochrome c biogenesis protein ResB [Candidatus Dormibacteria bacterium]